MKVTICDRMKLAVAKLLVQEGIDNGSLTEEMREDAIAGLMEGQSNEIDVDCPSD